MRFRNPEHRKGRGPANSHSSAVENEIRRMDCCLRDQYGQYFQLRRMWLKRKPLPEMTLETLSLHTQRTLVTACICSQLLLTLPCAAGCFRRAEGWSICIKASHSTQERSRKGLQSTTLFSCKFHLLCNPVMLSKIYAKQYTWFMII